MTSLKSHVFCLVTALALLTFWLPQPEAASIGQLVTELVTDSTVM